MASDGKEWTLQSERDQYFIFPFLNGHVPLSGSCFVVWSGVSCVVSRVVCCVECCWCWCWVSVAVLRRVVVLHRVLLGGLFFVFAYVSCKASM